MKSGVLGVALATIVGACALTGGVAQASIVTTIDISGTGKGIYSFNTDDPDLASFSTPLQNAMAGSSGFEYSDFYEPFFNVSGSVKGYSLDSDSGFGGSGYNSIYEENGTAYFIVSVYNNNFGAYPEFSSGTLSFSVPTEIFNDKGKRFSYVFGNEYKGSVSLELYRNIYPSDDFSPIYHSDETLNIDLQTITASISVVSEVPLPSALYLFGAALAAFGVVSSTKRRTAKTS